MNKKEKNLKKYLDKKKKHKTRDALMENIAALSKDTSKGLFLKVKKAKSKKNKRDIVSSFEDKIFDTNEREIIENDLSKNDVVDSLNHKAMINEESSVNYNGVVEIVSNSFQEIDKNHLMDNTTIKSKIIDLDERFELVKFINRLPEIQNNRQKMEIFYSEHEIIEKIKYNLVTFVQGMTGCGKTTQIPQFLVENGFTSNGIIGITQPRRISAISIASRLNTEISENISGYKIKYENNITVNTKIKVMTEGILFKEIQSDFYLKDYSVIILDEVHERSAYMDILIGLLSKIVSLRFEMKIPLRLILMSATVDFTKFKSIFNHFEHINLSNKPFKVNVFYEAKTLPDYLEATFQKIKGILNSENLGVQKRKNKNTFLNIPDAIVNDHTASILVFLPSKEDIYVLRDKIYSLKTNFKILPLHSGLSRSEQDKVFMKYDIRKIILATNIAETSVTIDDIVFVIDSGRVKRRIVDQNTVIYKVGFISKSSADQRMGRSGRTREGVCYRIYSGDTYSSFDTFEIPQILMEPFDSIFLQLKRLGIKNIFTFPFLDNPGKEMILSTINNLEGLGALSDSGKITDLGKKMCKYSVDPRYAKFLVLNSGETIFYKLAVIVSFLNSNFELKKTEKTKNYFDNKKSDLLVYLSIFIDFVKTKNRLKYCKNLGISYETLENISKMSSYLMKVAENSNFSLDIDNDIEELICKKIFYMFSDHLAVKNSEYYIYKDADIFISNDSIDVIDKNIVFDYIVCGTSKLYAKNITIIPEKR